MGWFSNLFGGGQAKAAKKASKVQQEGAKKIEDFAKGETDENLGFLDKALADALGQYDKGIAGLDPFAKAGTTALDSLMSALGLKGSGAANTFLQNFKTSPGYQFQMGQGVKALDSSAAAKGGLYSGAQGKALTSFGQGLADQEWDDMLGNLQNLVTGGQNAAGNIAGIFNNKAGAMLGTGQSKVGANQFGMSAIIDAINSGTAANAGGIINAANFKSQGLGNLLNLIGGAGKFALGGAFGGGLGGASALANLFKQNKGFSGFGAGGGWG